MATVLITGANRGIGLEFVRQYAADGWHVVAACRDPAEAADLELVNGDVVKQPLDVTSAESVSNLVEATGGEPVDVLINNAGVYLDRGIAFGEFDYERWRESFEVNVLGPMRLAEGLADAVAASKRRFMVFITSQMGSIADNTSGGAYAYRSSKAAGAVGRPASARHRLPVAASRLGAHRHGRQERHARRARQRARHAAGDRAVRSRAQRQFPAL